MDSAWHGFSTLSRVLVLCNLSECSRLPAAGRAFQYPQSGISPLQPRPEPWEKKLNQRFSTLSRVLVLCNRPYIR